MASDDQNIPPNRLTRHNIGDHASALRELITEDVFVQVTRGYADLATAKELPQYFERLARAHPFAVGWHELQQAVEAGTIALSEQAFFLLDMRVALMAAARDPEFAKLLNRLRGDDEFFSATFEAFIFCMYAIEFKLPVAFVPMGEGERPDLVSDFGDAGKVYIECKSLLDDERVEDRVWNSIREAITRKLENRKQSIDVDIAAKRIITTKDAANIVTNIIQYIEDNTDNISVEVGGCIVTIRTLLNESEVISLPIDFDVDPDYKVVFGAEHNSKEATRLWLVKTKAFPSSNQSARLRALFKKARDQLPSDHPGIVHFQIPYRNAKHFQDALDECRDDLVSDLARRKHICAIVITGRFLDKNRGNGSDPIMSFHSVMPNYKADMELPKDFRLLGNHPMTTAGGRVISDFELPSEGNIYIEFEIARKMDEQTGRYLIQYCSSDGRRQLNLWQDFFDRSRLEFWHEESGYHFLEFDMIGIVSGKTNKAVIQWSGGGLAVALNGAMLAKSGVDPVAS